MQLPQEVERLARLVAIRTGKSPEVIIREAIENRAREAGVPVPGRRRGGFHEQRVRAIIARVSALPVLDDRHPDDIVGYNEHGVPE